MYDVSDFTLNDVYVNVDAETTTYYFDCPLGFLEKYVDMSDVDMSDVNSDEECRITKGEISIEEPISGEEIYQTAISPVAEYNDGDESSIDWFDIDLEDSFVEALLNSVRTIKKGASYGSWN